MKHLIKRVSALLLAFQISLCSAVTSYAEVPPSADPRYWVSMSVAISALLACYGLKRTIAGSADATALIEECITDAVKAGYGVLKNGAYSVGIGVKDNVSYISKDFANWVLSWSLEKDIFNPPVGGLSYSSFLPNNTYTITSGETIPELASYIGIPADVMEEYYDVTTNTNNKPAVIGVSNAYVSWGTTTQRYAFYEISEGSQVSFKNNSDQIVETSQTYYGTTVEKNIPQNGEIYFSSSDRWSLNLPVGGYYQKNVFGFGSKAAEAGINCYNSWNAVRVPGVDYGVTTDVPVEGQSIDDYAPSWAARGDTVAIDDIQTNAIPLSFPIDGVSSAITDTVAAADVIAGTAAAIAAAGAMAQEVARAGEIAVEATETLTDAIETAETVETLNGEYTIHGLEDVFPFCLPWDFAEFVGLLNASPEAPKFSLPILDTQGNLVYYEFDFSPFSPVAAVGRTGETILFILGLIVLTKRLFV